MRAAFPVGAPGPRTRQHIDRDALGIAHADHLWYAAGKARLATLGAPLRIYKLPLWTERTPT